MKRLFVISALVGLLLAVGAPMAGETASTPRHHAADSLTVLTLNIWHDQDDWPRRRELILDRLQTLEPDIVCLQEVLQNPELPNQAKTLADRLGYEFAFASVDSVGAAKRYGNAILTRHPILEENAKRLQPNDDYRVAAHVRLQIGARPVSIYNTHLHYSGDRSGTAVRSTQIRDVLAFVEATRESDPVIVAGDFNTPPGAAELDLLSPLLQDAYAMVHPERATDRPTTLNPYAGHTPRFIDYIFSSTALRPTAVEILFDEPAADSTWASDHFGVFSRFAFAPEPADH